MPEPLDPNKFYVMPAQTKQIIMVLGVVFLVMILPLLTFVYYKAATLRPSPLDKEITFEINSGDGVAVVAKNLYARSAVNSEFLFSLYVFLNKLDKNIQAGVYTIKAGTPLVDLVPLFQHGTNDTKITFIEGWRVEEFAILANKSFENIDYAEFVRKAQAHEGYLFPDTYYFVKDVREDEMIETLTNTFDEKTKDLFTAEALEKVGLNKDQIVILASIIEREVSKNTDRAMVAGILLNRFRIGMKLDADATTQYVAAKNNLCGDNSAGICAPPLEEIEKFNWWPKTLTQVDLDLDNPYNTRKVAGLPPSPISSPSLDAIKAVINFEPNDYIFYLTDEYGVTHYAKTIEEHNANIAEFLQ